MPKLKKKKTDVDLALETAYANLRDCYITDDDYAVILDRISKLHELKASSSPKPVSKDTLVLTGAQIAAVVIIVAYEHTHVITSKALGFVPKP